MKVITPTIGRKVWWWAHGEQEGLQPEDATVVYVHSDRCVNLRVTDHNGVSRAVTSAHLKQPGDEDNVISCYATWMPYQVGQATKHETSGASA